MTLGSEGWGGGQQQSWCVTSISWSELRLHQLTWRTKLVDTLSLIKSGITLEIHKNFLLVPVHNHLVKKVGRVWRVVEAWQVGLGQERYLGKDSRPGQESIQNEWIQSIHIFFLVHDLPTQNENVPHEFLGPCIFQRRSFPVLLPCSEDHHCHCHSVWACSFNFGPVRLIISRNPSESFRGFNSICPRWARGAGAAILVCHPHQLV